MAQQMQIESDQGLTEFTFRKWNPDMERVMWGSDNGNTLEPTCPIPFLFGYIAEITCFRLIFKETVDHCGPGEKSPWSIIDDYNKGSNITGFTNMFRILNWIISVAGNFMIFSPLTPAIVWIPFVGTLLKSTFMFTGVIFSMAISTILQFLVASIAWIPYRPVVASFLLVFSTFLLGLMALG